MKPGLVTLAGKPVDDLAPGTLNSIYETGGTQITKGYVIVIEKIPTGYSAYSPDLPGCVATGASRAEVGKNVREAITFHLDGMREEGEPVPEPHTYSTYVEQPA